MDLSHLTDDQLRALSDGIFLSADPGQLIQLTAAIAWIRTTRTTATQSRMAAIKHAVELSVVTEADVLRW
ncbi:hypothetical protein [Streptacidiphilus sp. EB103A]|uniref:hypothetical protein n=1 Tax=Streptacidiphilus sp. EB103A TaxID=3156275 RepID=UPI0035193E18